MRHDLDVERVSRSSRGHDLDADEAQESSMTQGSATTKKRKSSSLGTKDGPERARGKVLKRRKHTLHSASSGSDSEDSSVEPRATWPKQGAPDNVTSRQLVKQTPGLIKPFAKYGVDMVTDNDVLSGRGGGTNSHPGNRVYRDLIMGHMARYETATKKEKPDIARDIVQLVRDKGGRFLRKDEKDGMWYDIGDDAARDKTSQALRHRTFEKRQYLVQKNQGSATKNPPTESESKQPTNTAEEPVRAEPTTKAQIESALDLLSVSASNSRQSPLNTSLPGRTTPADRALERRRDESSSSAGAETGLGMSLSSPAVGGLGRIPGVEGSATDELRLTELKIQQLHQVRKQREIEELMFLERQRTLLLQEERLQQQILLMRGGRSFPTTTQTRALPHPTAFVGAIPAPLPGQPLQASLSLASTFPATAHTRGLSPWSSIDAAPLAATSLSSLNPPHSSDDSFLPGRMVTTSRQHMMDQQQREQERRGGN